jgi:hypothetical protein
LPVFSPIIGTFGNQKQIAKIANHLRAIGNLGNQKQIANIANGPPPAPPDQPRHQAWIVMPIRSVNRSVC